MEKFVIYIFCLNQILFCNCNIVNRNNLIEGYKYVRVIKFKNQETPVISMDTSVYYNYKKNLKNIFLTPYKKIKMKNGKMMNVSILYDSIFYVEKTDSGFLKRNKSKIMLSKDTILNHLFLSNNDVESYISEYESIKEDSSFTKEGNIKFSYSYYLNNKALGKFTLIFSNKKTTNNLSENLSQKYMRDLIEFDLIIFEKFDENNILLNDELHINYSIKKIKLSPKEDKFLIDIFKINFN
jgi:hypothetical protein